MRNSHIAPTRPPKHNSPDIIILGADICYGMKSYGPQVLLKIKDKPLIEYQLEIIQSIFPRSDVMLVTGFGSSKVIRRCPKTVRIIENQLYKETNEPEQLRLALNCSLSDSAIIMTDGLIFNKNTLQFNPTNTSLLYDSTGQISENDIGLNVVNDYVTSLSYESKNKWCYILYLTGREYKIIQDLCKEPENKRLFLHEILNQLVEKSKKISAIEPKGMKITKINNSRDLTDLQ